MSASIPSYLRKLDRLGLVPGDDESSILASLETLNEIEWMDLICDSLNASPWAERIVGAYRGASIAARVIVLAGRAAPASRLVVAGACKRLLDSGIAGMPDGRRRVLQLLGNARHPLASELLKSLLNSAESSIRAQAAGALANAGTETKEFWNDRDLVQFPELAPATVAAVTDLDPVLCIRILQNLESHPVPVEDLRGPVNDLIAVAEQTQSGKRALQRARLEAGPWLLQLLGAPEPNQLWAAPASFWLPAALILLMALVAGGLSTVFLMLMLLLFAGGMAVLSSKFRGVRTPTAQ